MSKINSGRKTPGGTTVYFCECLVKWVPKYEAKLKAAGIIKYRVDILQGSYHDGAYSGGTHSKGGALDTAQYSWEAVKIARQMGAAMWKRTPAQGFSYHGHLILIGCPHNSPANYQVQAYKAGYNGLGYMGRGGKDDGPRVPYITWYDGIKTTVSLVNILNGIKYNSYKVDITRVQLCLKKKNLYTATVDGKYGPATKAAYQKYQKSIGYTGSAADGIPGRTSLSKLVSSYGYRAV